jgi:arylformamidase
MGRRSASTTTRTTVAGVAAGLGVAAMLLSLVGCGGGTGDQATVGAPGATTTPTSVVDAGCTTTGSPTTVTYEQAPGVDPNLVSLDVYGLPPGCAPAPVVFWVHGGGWSKGDKANEGTTTKAAWAAAHGWVLVAVNYRLSTPGSGVVWPTHGRDVAAAVGYTLDHAGQFGIDPAHVALMGHSAGAHIVSFLAVAPDLLATGDRPAPKVDCLVALDTEGYDLVERVGSGGDITDEMVSAAFGTDEGALVAASPLQTLEAGGGPVPDAVIVTRGVPRRKAQATGFADALRAAGADVTVVDATGYSHADVNQRLGTAGDSVVTPPVTTFLQTCLT